MKNNADDRYPRPSRQENIRAMAIIGLVSAAVCLIVYLAQLTVGMPDEPSGEVGNATSKSNP